MTFGSLFAGIGGFDLGLERAGMDCQFQIERDEACNRVLSRRWPTVERHKDVCEFSTATTSVRPRLLCGGFPCQDLSVAGKRAGLAGKRSGLFHEFCRIIGEFSPRWILLENVPGLLSSNGWADMGTVVWALGQLGYGWAYRSLDVQYNGVAQRRERVFIVGCLGDWRRAAEVLFEPESLPGHPAPSRKAGSRVAATLTGGAHPGSHNGQDDHKEGRLIVTYEAHNYSTGEYRECDISSPLTTGTDGTRSAPLVFDTTQITSPGNYSNPKPGDPCHPLSASGHSPALVIPIDMRQASRGERMTNNRRNGSSGGPPGTGIGSPGDPAPTVSGSHPPAVFAIQERAVSESSTAGPGGKGFQPELAYTLEARHTPQSVGGRFGVRRMLPIECERVQGFPDGWTAGESDSARYRMIGNAVAPPEAEWIGRRIMQVEDH